MIEAGGVANGTPGVPTDDRRSQCHRRRQPGDGWQAVAAGAASANGYGTYALTAAGVWTYTLDDSNAAVQALNVGGTLTDTLHGRHRRRHHAAGHHHHQRRRTTPPVITGDSDRRA